MKKNLLLTAFALMFAAVIVTGCGKSDTATDNSMTPSSTNSMPASTNAMK